MDGDTAAGRYEGLDGVGRSKLRSEEEPSRSWYRNRIGWGMESWGGRLVANSRKCTARAGLGFERVRLVLHRGGSDEVKTFEYFMSLEFKIQDIYSMRGAFGPHTSRGSWKKTKRGDTAPMVLVQTHAGVMMGCKDKDATCKEIIQDVWMKSGDLAMIY